MEEDAALEEDEVEEAAAADNAFDNGEPGTWMLTEDDVFDDELVALPQAEQKSITETAAMANNFRLCCITITLFLIFITGFLRGNPSL